VINSRLLFQLTQLSFSTVLQKFQIVRQHRETKRIQLATLSAFQVLAPTSEKNGACRHYKCKVHSLFQMDDFVQRRLRYYTC